MGNWADDQDWEPPRLHPRTQEQSPKGQACQKIGKGRATAGKPQHKKKKELTWAEVAKNHDKELTKEDFDYI